MGSHSMGWNAITSPLFTYASRVSIDKSSVWKASYRATLSGNCFMLGIVLLFLLHPKDDIDKLNILAFDPRMRESV